MGRKWAQAGHSVVFGVRDPQSAKARVSLEDIEGKAQLAGIGEAIQSAEVIVLAIPGSAVEEMLAEHAQALEGKLVIDATNRMGSAEMSAVPQIAARVPSAKVFRAFNNLGWENFAEPVFNGIQADLLYCGPGGAAQQEVERLIADIGLRPMRVGEIDQVRLVDAMTSVWFALAVGQGLGRHLAFKVLRE